MYNGTIGGIGQGLQSFVSAYQTALNYQLEKAKAASLTDYQQKMADAADQNAQTAKTNALSEQAQARGKLLELGGSSALDYYGKDILPSNSSPVDMSGVSNSPLSQESGANAPQTAPQAPPAPPTPAQANPGLLKANNPGFVGPPMANGLITNPANMGPQQLPSQSPPQGLVAPTSPAQQAQGGPPQIMAPWQRQALMAAQKEASDKTAESAAAGTNVTYGVDPQNPTTIKMISQGQLSGDAALSAKQKQAQIGTETLGARSPLQNAQNNFNENDSVKAAKQSKVYMDQMLQNLKDPSPQGQASLFLNALRIKFPSAPDVGSLDELSKSESAPVQMRNMASKYINGTMDPQQINDLVRDGIATFESNAGGYKSAQNDFIQKSTDQYGLSPQQAKLITQNSGIDQTLQNALAVKKQIGSYKTPQQQGGLLSPVYGLVNKVLGNTSGTPVNAAQSNPAPSNTAQDQIAIQWAKSNPKDPRSKTILQMHGMQ